MNYDYVYDNLGRLTAETQDIAGLTPDVEFAHAWNANSRRTQLTAEIGNVADFKNDYAYDNLSRMTQVIQQDVTGGNVVADKRVDLAYNALGQYTSIARYQSTGTSNHVATSTFTYDTLNRLTDLDHKQGSTNLALYDYTYDFMDRITSMTHSVDGASTFTYDKVNEVTAADHANPRADESYSFDATGNRTGGSYTNTTNNRTTADANYTYAYDSEGNRATRTKISNDYVTEYEWDHRNRLVGVNEKDDMGNVLSTVDYFYDAFNRLVRRTYDDDGPGMDDPTDQFFAYDGGSINPVLDFDGTEDTDLAHRNLWAEAIDQLLATEDMTSPTSAGNVLWPLGDHQNTYRDIADINEGTGVTSVTNHLTINAFGITTAETNGSVEFAFGFMAKPFDEATGLIYYVNRWYDPFLGKWLSHDPIDFGGGDPNLSRAVENSTPNRSDPYGLQGELSPGSLSTADTSYAGATANATEVDCANASRSSNHDRASLNSMMVSNLTSHISPTAGFLLGINNITTQDIRLMGQSPVRSWLEGVGCMSHGGLMVLNQATFQLITPLDNHVNHLIEIHGGSYGIANVSASIGVTAGYCNRSHRGE